MLMHKQQTVFFFVVIYSMKKVTAIDIMGKISYSEMRVYNAQLMLKTRGLVPEGLKMF